MTLEPDVAEALKRRARRTGQPFRRNVNEVIRLGLLAEKARPAQAYRIKPLSLADALEDEAQFRKLELRK
jgi:hypothetical protein